MKTGENSMPIIGDAPMPPLPLTELTGPSTRRIAKAIFQEKETSRNNFFGIEDWAEHFHDWGIRFSENDLREAEKFPWDEHVLRAADPEEQDKEIRETHFAFFGLTQKDGEPLTIQLFLEWLWDEAFENLWRTSWFHEKEFTKKTIDKPQWHLMRIKPFTSGRIPKVFDGFSENGMYEYASVLEEFMKNMLAGLKMGIRPNKDTYALCREEQDQALVHIGGWDIRGVHTYASVAELERILGTTGQGRFGFSAKLKSEPKKSSNRVAKPTEGIAMYS